MNASEAKEKVLKVWPDAELVGYFDGAYAIFSRLAHHASTTGYIGWGQTTYKVSSTLASSQAWIDAASRLPEEKEPAPKEGGQVEAGDALPPLDKEWEVEVQVLMRDGRDDMDRTRAVLHCRERQLKASMLREKGKDEEIERLKGLLRDIQEEAYDRADIDDEGRPNWAMSVHERIKAAVTGEKP